MRFRHTADRSFAIAIEAFLLFLVVVSPWAFGAVEPVFEFLLYVGVALLLVLWAGRMLCQWRFTWKKCPVALCLAAFFLLGIWQLQPLPRAVLNGLSPGTVRLCDELLPAQPEALPLGETYQRPSLAAGNRLSLYPGATRKELIRLLAVFLLFVVVRNNVASPASLRRLFLALVVNGMRPGSICLVPVLHVAAAARYRVLDLPNQGSRLRPVHLAHALSLLPEYLHRRRHRPAAGEQYPD